MEGAGGNKPAAKSTIVVRVVLPLALCSSPTPAAVPATQGFRRRSRFLIPEIVHHPSYICTLYSGDFPDNRPNMHDAEEASRVHPVNGRPNQTSPPGSECKYRAMRCRSVYIQQRKGNTTATAKQSRSISPIRPGLCANRHLRAPIATYASDHIFLLTPYPHHYLCRQFRSGLG